MCQADHPTVLDGAAEYLYESAVTDGVEESLKAKVDHIHVAVPYDLLRLPQCIVAATMRLDAIAPTRERGIIDGGQYLVDGLLHQSVYHGRYAQ